MAVKARKESESLPEWLEAARTRGLLGRLPDSTVAELVENAHRVEYPKGAVILRWVDSATTLIVLRGALRSYLADEEGRQVTIRYLRPGDVVGLVPEREIPATRGLHVLEACEILILSQRRIREFAESDPGFAVAALEELSAIMSTALCAVYMRSFGSVRQRVANAILDRAVLSGGVIKGRAVLGTQHELAMSVGTVREVVASTLQDLKRERLIEIRRGEVVIVDPAGLMREARAIGRCAATDGTEPAAPPRART